MKGFSDLLSLPNIAFTLIAVLVASFVVTAYVKKSTLDILGSSNAILRTELNELRTSYHSQESRLSAAELDRERGGMLLSAAREEIRILEHMVRIAITCLSCASEFKGEHERIMSDMTDLKNFRDEENRRRDEWESATITHLAWVRDHEEKSASSCFPRRSRRMGDR